MDWETFIDMYKEKVKDSDLMLLDAVTMNTDRKFDCIYSNKVLHHLTRKELKQSFVNQKKVLKDDGLLFHSFWYGNKSEEFNGLLFTYYTEKQIKRIVEKNYHVIEIERYKELEDNDSFYVVLRKK